MYSYLVQVSIVCMYIPRLVYLTFIMIKAKRKESSLVFELILASAKFKMVTGGLVKSYFGALRSRKVISCSGENSHNPLT